MKPIFWGRELVRPVEEWDRLSLLGCERLLRGLYRCAAVAVSAEAVDSTASALCAEAPFESAGRDSRRAGNRGAA